MFFGVVLAGVIGLEDTGEAIAVPLLATQILWINLLTDGAPALALGMDAPPDDVMSQPPRRLTDRVLDAEMWIGIVWVGAVMAAVTLLALDLRLPGGFVGGSGERLSRRGRWRSRPSCSPSSSTASTPSSIARAPSTGCSRTAGCGARSRSPRHFRSPSSKLPFLNDAFGTTPLGAEEWLICIGLASVVRWADEAKKLLERRLRRRR